MEKICLFGFTWLFVTMILLGLSLLAMMTSVIFYAKEKNRVFFLFVYSMLVPLSTAFFMFVLFKLVDDRVSCEAMRKMDLLAVPTAIAAFMSGLAVFMMLKRKLKRHS